MIDERAYYQHWKKYEEDKTKAEELRKTLRDLIDDSALSDDHLFKSSLLTRSTGFCRQRGIRGM